MREAGGVLCLVFPEDSGMKAPYSVTSDLQTPQSCCFILCAGTAARDVWVPLPSGKSAEGWERAPLAFQKAQSLQVEQAVSKAMAAGTGHSKGDGCHSRLA